MLKVFFLSCILLTRVFLYGQKNIDVLHYQFEIGLSDLSDTIKGKATVTARFLQPVDTFTLDMIGVNANTGKGMQPVLSGTDKVVFKDDKFRIIPSGKIKAGDVRTYVIAYKGIPADGLIISKNKFGHRTFFSDNWPDRARHWIPCVDNPADKASVEFIVTAPAHYQVVSNGIQVEETNLPGDLKLTHWKEDIPLPTKVMVIGAADFAVQQAGTVGCVPVSSWVFPDNRQEGFLDYAPAKDILSFFIDYIGPYPYKKLANIQSKTIFGGMENAGAIFYFENSVNGRQNQDGLIAHEIVHQWFGDMATEKSFAHLWLSEGFATYLTILYMEKKYGADTARLLRATDRQQVIDFVKTSDRPVVDSISAFMDLLNNNSYQKGGWVLHMLRRLLGDTVFHKGIQQYYAAYAGKNADTRDLQAIFEKVSGKNLSGFFQQWLYTPGIPTLDIQWNYVVAERKINLTIKQLQKDLFRFSLELLIETSPGKSQVKTVEVTELIQSFSIPVKEKPLLVKADPGVNLLFEGSSTAIK
jgi:aminopeptidase N